MLVLCGTARVRDSRDPEAKQARGAARELQAALRKALGGKATARGVWDDGEWRVRVELSAIEARAVAQRVGGRRGK